MGRILPNFKAVEAAAVAISKLKQLKRWQRDWKRNLIGRENPARMIWWRAVKLQVRQDHQLLSPLVGVDPHRI